MNELSLSRSPDGTLVVDRIPALLAELVRELPKHLVDEHPEAVERRLLPDPTDDPDEAAEWRRTQHPELLALFASAREVVTNDLSRLVRGSAARTWRLSIPAGHELAWISALNTARLVLGALHDVRAEDLSPEREIADDERGVAVLRIELYAWLQGTLIEAVSPSGDRDID